MEIEVVLVVGEQLDVPAGDVQVVYLLDTDQVFDLLQKETLGEVRDLLEVLEEHLEYVLDV